MSTPRQIATLLRSIADVLDGAVVQRVEENLITEIEAAREVLAMEGEESAKIFEEAAFEEEEEDDALDITELRSNCCNSQIVAVNGEDGTSFYKCMSCGDACDWHHKDSPLPPPERQTRAKRKVTFDCCGSRNWKHKNGCSGPQIAIEPRIEENRDEEEPKPDAGKYECDECSHEFSGVDTGDVMKCPECQSTNVWPSKVV